MEQIYEVIMGVFCDDYCIHRDKCRADEDDLECPVDDSIRKALTEHFAEK